MPHDARSIPAPPSAIHARGGWRRWRIVPLGFAIMACSDGNAAPPETSAAWEVADTLPGTAEVLSRNDHRVAALVAGADGSRHVLLLDDADGDAAGDRLFHLVFDGERWRAPTRLDAHDGRTEAPQLVVDGGGRAHAFWYEGDAGSSELREVVHRVWSGGGWSAPRTLQRATAGQPLLPLLSAAVDAEGAIHLLHTEGPGPLRHRVYTGGTWRVLGTLPIVDGPSPHLLRDPRGGLALAEISALQNPFSPGGQSFGNAQVRLYRDGGWTVAAPVHPAPGEHAHDPQLAFDARGVMHAVWLQGENGEVFPTRLLHASSANGVAWSAPAEVARVGRGQSFYSPSLVADGRGGLHLAFARFETQMSNPRHFHARFDGRRWSAPREIAPAAGPRDSELEAASGPGGVSAVWESGDGRYLLARLVPRE